MRGAFGDGAGAGVVTKEHSPRLCPKCGVNWISGEETCDCDVPPLVERLRKGTCAFSSWPANSGQVCDIMIEAANAIERLRAALDSIARDELAEAWNADSAGGGPEGWQDDYWRVVNIARSAVQPETPK